MRKISLLLCLTLVAGLVSLPASAAVPQAEKAKKSLYQRLGGYDAIAAVTDDFIGRLASDPKEGRFFVGLSTDSKKRTRQHIVDFLCSATGGPCIYTGRDMTTAHTGLGITEEDWTISVKHLTDTLNKFKVPPAEQTDVINAIAPLKSQIVGK
ncbi:MAG TPA: group 1 truncated hemoglobin [Terriglobales bacterium]|nr:group 1 truncated hemoglobin [Terriglobales bacterium]